MSYPTLARWHCDCFALGMSKIIAVALLAGALAPAMPAWAGSPPPRPNPRWKVRVTIFTRVDFRYTDSAGNPHHVTTAMTSAEISRSVESSRRFFEVDVPALNGGAMKPVSVTVVEDRPLTALTRICGDTGYWPFPSDVSNRLPFSQYDSHVLIWKGAGWDSETNAPAELGCYGGLAFYMGTGPTFTTMTQVMVDLNHRNVFKHEWGHSILFYYDAAGTAPRPTVDNHIGPGMYVHCGTAVPYVLMDEDDDNPIPNSIYNNQSGFHRDYYSGQTAQTGQPNACLGIGPQVWATGGPLTRPIANPGDLNNDRVVNSADLAMLMQGVGKPPTGPADRRDLDYDGAITVSDARLLVLYCTKPYCAY